MLAATLLSACSREIHYVIARGTTHGWIVVEYRDHCPPAIMHGGSITYVIPASRYLSSSSEPPAGMTRWRYYAVDAEGRRHEIDIAKHIHSQMRTQRVLPCKYDTDAFYFGPAETMAGDPDAVILARRPECVPR